MPNFCKQRPCVSIRVGAYVCAFLFSLASAMAMEFSIERMPDGMRLVLGVGEIVPGDTARLSMALESADRDSFGNKNLALHSVGGSVREALSMVRLMDRENVSTIVPPKMSCASACAQIVFVSGKHRVVLTDGRLGIHTCSRGGIPAPLCNDDIAENAINHGVPHGSVMAFMRYAGPSEMMWFDDKDADCWGLTRWPDGFDRGTRPGDIPPCVQRGLQGRTP
jgi:hypothetical protein